MHARPLAIAIATALMVVAVSSCSHRTAQQPTTVDETRSEVASNEPADRERDQRAPAKLLLGGEAAKRVAEEKPGSAPVAGALADSAATAAQPMPATIAGRLALAPPAPPANALPGQYWEPSNRENYADHADNPVLRTAETPVSTFSIDVDTGSYSNVRRMIAQGTLPPSDAVRAEEFINYFDYGYEPPRTLAQPFSVTTEVAPAPWNAQRQLLLVGLKGYEVPASEIPASNLVFLIDTSGSMQTPDKLPLLKQSFKQMVAGLDARSSVAIVVYAGSAGLILPPTRGDQKQRIIEALDSLEAGGSTNGGAGIELAYQMARQAKVEGGVNRVILATDGDFNVGTVDIEALKTLVAEQRKSGVALTTLGFGQGNYNDELAEQLADIGNGNHAYIDTLNEARKVLVDEMSATMLTIAKDVKIQIEFNPAVVAEYRLIGYENRMLRREDFDNDKIDAGEIGAGHDVTALYELSLVGSPATQIAPLRYGNDVTTPARASGSEIAFLKLRWKKPDEDTSRLIEQPVARGDIAGSASPRLRFAAAVAGFADALRGGTHLGEFDLAAAAALAESALGEDRFGYRVEFVDLVRRAAAQRGETSGTQVAISR